MSLPETATIEIKVRNAAAYTLNNVVATARSCSPQDLKLAAANIELVEESGKIPAEVTDFVNFVVTDLFTLLHRSGLYNRQRAFWESIARAVRVTVHPVTQGFFRKETLPMFDVHFEDASGGTTLLALVVQNHAQWKVPRYATEYFKELLHRAQQSDKKRPVLKTVMVVAPSPFSQELFKYVDKILGGPNLDTVSRFESVIQNPLTVHVNLIEYGVAADGETMPEHDSGFQNGSNGTEGTEGAQTAEVENFPGPKSLEAEGADDPSIIADEAILPPDAMKKRQGRFIFKMIQPDVEKARKK